MSIFKRDTKSDKDSAKPKTGPAKPPHSPAAMSVPHVMGGKPEDRRPGQQQQSGSAKPSQHSDPKKDDTNKGADHSKDHKK